MKTGVAVVGCGAIARNAYLPSFTTTFANRVEVVACCDVSGQSAAAAAETFGIPNVATLESILSDPRIAIIVNLTIPEAHAEVNRAALRAGKHVYCEKPLALALDDARELAALARERGLMLACAPDTLLGSGMQSCRRALDEGAIGEPRFAAMELGMQVMVPRYYREGVGPLLDMAPYFIGALVALLGPVRSVVAFGTRPRIEPPEGQGDPFDPAVPARVALAMELASGALATLAIATDARLYTPRLDITGSAGVMHCPDPNKVEGFPVIRTSAGEEPYDGGFAFRERARGVGVAEMAAALAEGRPHRLGADLALHVTEVLLLAGEAIASGTVQQVQSACARPAPMSPIVAGDPFAIAAVAR